MIEKIKKKIHIFHNIFIKHKYLLNKNSYSMDGEDIFINNFFSKKKNGFYIDVGCYHPIHRNNTFLLYKKGWRGINIDIHQFSIDLFDYLRPNDFNFNYAVSNKDEIIDMYYQKKLSQISTIEKFQANKAFQGNIKKSKIKSFRLDSILKMVDLKDLKIDLLDIDVEGADLKVLEGFSVEKFKPKLICIEIHEKEISKSEIFKYLISFGYELVWSGVFSHIFRSKA